MGLRLCLRKRNCLHEVEDSQASADRHHSIVSACSLAGSPANLLIIKEPSTRQIDELDITTGARTGVFDRNVNFLLRHEGRQ